MVSRPRTSRSSPLGFASRLKSEEEAGRGVQESDANPMPRETVAAEPQVAPAAGRFDRVLADLFPELSRMAAKRAILAGDASLAGRVVTDPAATVQAGDAVGVRIAPPEPAEPAAQAMDLRVLYEDADLIVIDKPAGLVVHPAAGNADHTLVNALIAHCGASLSGIGGVRRPGIVHRLDKDTSGIIVAAKHDRAHLGLAAQFAAHSVDRAYAALVWGWPAPEGAFDGAIGRDPKNRKKMAVIARGGRTALTRYRVLERFAHRGKPLAALLECRLATGRTHQIRVHLAHAGHPVLGDPVYGRSRAARKDLPESIFSFPRQALHAGRLGFFHPVTSVWRQFDAAPPRDLLDLIGVLRQYGKPE
jgi:23S rRNA pseudouridine1911/1915/1917 synthase